MESSLADSAAEPGQAPHPGAQDMPRWNLGTLPDAPRFQWKNLWQFLGPGLLMGGAAIGGGEWLLGPRVTAMYGGGLLWLATLSILGQVLYNIEISRYTLYTGEPIFTGKCRTLPGPLFWVLVYLALDFGTVFPYLAASAATPIVTMYLGKVPDPIEHGTLLRGLSLVIFGLALLPMVFGGKVYNSLKLIMTFKIVVVMGFLLILAFFYSHAGTWTEIFSGFFKFGQVPVGTEGDLDNVLVALWEGREMPKIDLSMAAFLSGLVAISGQGGLSNTPISNYTRDQGWGMGSHVGAIPSLVGGHNIQLSHMGTVFLPDQASLPRWKRWYYHVVRDQAFVWAPACFFGLALPSMLSVEFLKRGKIEQSDWTLSVMTADAVRERAGEQVGQMLWMMTLFCGFVVLAPSMASTIDGFVRRWVDVFWTASKWLHTLDPSKIKNVYFAVLSGYALFGVVMLGFVPSPGTLLKIATSIYNFALGFSCWHVVAINSTLLPKPLRPNWIVRILLTLIGLFFWTVATVAAYKLLQDLGVISQSSG
ncbi:MAG: Nramp family divalent metal transporter [Planctomycetales bacterium]